MLDTLALLKMLELHTLDSRPIWIQPEQIISLTPPKENQLLVRGVGCIVSLTDAKFVSVKESCADIRAMIRETP